MRLVLGATRRGQPPVPDSKRNRRESSQVRYCSRPCYLRTHHGPALRMLSRDSGVYRALGQPLDMNVLGVLSAFTKRQGYNECLGDDSALDLSCALALPALEMT